MTPGVCVYGGVGTYEYELELLDDQNSGGNDPSHSQRWNSLELCRGTFTPDDCIGEWICGNSCRPGSVTVAYLELATSEVAVKSQMLHF